MKRNDPNATQRFLEEIAAQIDAQNAVLRQVAEQRGEPGLFGEAIAFRPVKAKQVPRMFAAIRA